MLEHNLDRLSHSGKTVHRTLFTPVCRLVSPFRVPNTYQKRGRPFGRPRYGVQDEEGQRNDILLQSPLIIRYRIWFHNPTDCAPISSDSPTAGKQSTGLFSNPPFEPQSIYQKRGRPFGRPRYGVQDEEGKRNNILLQSPLIIRLGYGFTILRIAKPYPRTLPRRENRPQDCFLIRLSSPNPYTKKEAFHSDGLFFGARDGTRTHTAITTRTSNVLVYHSNTLASCCDIITSFKLFVNPFFLFCIEI